MTGPAAEGEPDVSVDPTMIGTLEDLGGVLRHLRRRQARTDHTAELTYRQLERMTGYPKSLIGGYFLGQILPKSDKLDYLAMVLGATDAERRTIATVRDRIEDRRRARPTAIGPDHRLPAELDTAPVAASSGADRNSEAGDSTQHPFPASGGRTGGTASARERAAAIAVAVTPLAVLSVFLVPLAEAAHVSWLIGVAAIVATAAAGVVVRDRRREPRSTELTYTLDKLNQLVLRDEARQRLAMLGATTPADIRFEHVAVRFQTTGGHADGALANVFDYYLGLSPRRLVILGEPGSGKTILALELLLHLAERRDSSAREPVPVRFALTGWDTRVPLEDWMIEHLTTDYRIPGPMARTIVHARLILPILDGLDEMNPDRAVDALARMNTYEHGRALGPLVVTCRAAEYDTLRQTGAGGVHDATTVVIQPLAPQELATFLHSRFRSDADAKAWHPVLDQLDQPGSDVARLLNTPWRVTLALTSYHAGHLSPDDLLGPRDHAEHELLQRFVPSSIHLIGRLRPAHYQPAESLAWLETVARHLDSTAGTRNGHAATELRLHDLWRVAGSTLSRILHTTLNIILITGTWAVCVTIALGWQHLHTFLANIESFPPPYLVEGGGLMIILVVWLGFGVGLGVSPSLMPRKAAIAEIRTPRNALRGIAIGALAGAVIATAATPWVGSTIGIAGGLGTCLATAAVVASSGGVSDDVTPLAPLRIDFFFGAIGGLVVGCGLTGAGEIALALGATTTDLDGTRGYTRVAAGAILSGVMIGLTLVSAASNRYATAVTILALRGRLPWHPGRFFAWAQHAGILRHAGIAFQFRHLELQQLLARPHNTTLDHSALTDSTDTSDI